MYQFHYIIVSRILFLILTISYERRISKNLSMSLQIYSNSQSLLFSILSSCLIISDQISNRIIQYSN